MPDIPSEVAGSLARGEFHVALRLDPNDFACNDFDDPDDYVHETTGRVILSDYGGDSIAEIGDFIVIQVDGDGVMAQGEHEVVPLGMLIVSRIVIRPEYRGREFGLGTLKDSLKKVHDQAA